MRTFYKEAINKHNANFILNYDTFTTTILIYAKIRDIISI